MKIFFTHFLQSNYAKIPALSKKLAYLQFQALEYSDKPSFESIINYLFVD